MSPADAENDAIRGLPLFFREPDRINIVGLLDCPVGVRIITLQALLQGDGDIRLAADAEVDGFSLDSFEPGRQGGLFHWLLSANGIKTFIDGIFLCWHILSLKYFYLPENGDHRGLPPRTFYHLLRPLILLSFFNSCGSILFTWTGGVNFWTNTSGARIK